VVEASAAPGSDGSVEMSAEPTSIPAPVLDESSADEPARDDTPAESPATLAKASSKSKRRSGASRDEAQSRPD